jgi:hypothetical protein
VRNEEAGDKIVVACCQLAPRVGELKHNRQIPRCDPYGCPGRGLWCSQAGESGYVFVDRAGRVACPEMLVRR